MDDLLEVDLPAHAPSLRIARLVVWEAATRAGFDCDLADDLCLALDEVCFATFAKVDAGDRLSLRILTATGVHIEGHVRTAGRSVVLGSLSETLVALAVDHFDLTERPDGVHFTLIKRAPVLELR